MIPVPPSLINYWAGSFSFSPQVFFIFGGGLHALKCNLLYLLAGGISLGLAVWLLPLQPAWIPLLMLSVALPPAVLNYMLCEQYQCQPEKVASIVLGGNALSVLVIPLAVWLALHLGS